MFVIVSCRGEVGVVAPVCEVGVMYVIVIHYHAHAATGFQCQGATDLQQPLILL